MKLLRLWLVVLLAVLLPVRGAMAATMPCAPAGGGNHHPAEAVDRGAGHAGHGAGHEHADSGHAHADAGRAAAPPDHGQGAHDHSSDDRCNLCSATCSSPPLPSAATGVDEPAALTSVSYPDLSAPAPTFQSDGQERPPRTR